jgi:twitching motility protein PilT
MEDPIEYIHNHQKCIVNQREMGMDSGSYATALRAALREDPDVLLVGEMRDLETISAAVTAAETGHLVFSTLHTIGAVNTIDRIIDVFPPYQQAQIRTQLADVLQCVVTQRLVPHSSGQGRVSISEVMVVTPAISNQIREGKTFQIVNSMQTGRSLGMITMDDSLLDAYIRCDIDRETALAYAQDPVMLSKRMF